MHTCRSAIILTNMSRPKVSIVVPAYNVEGTICECLDSLFAQTYQNKEIIVVDDGSIDETIEKVKKYDVKLILGHHGGQAEARNTGIKHATGEIIFQAEADAYYASNYVELCVRRLTEDPKIGTVIGSLHAWPENCVLSRWWEAKRRITLVNYKPLGGWLFKKDDLDKIGYYRNLARGVDRELCLRLRKELGLKFAYEPRALWWHKYPYSLRTFVMKSYSNARESVEFHKIIGIHRKYFFRYIAFLTFFITTLASIVLATFYSQYFIIPLIAFIAFYLYPTCQLRSKGLKLSEFKEYVILFPFFQGLEMFFNSLGYIVGLHASS